MEEVLSSSLAPSHSVFTALWLSLATWFPCQALLLCLHPQRLDLPGPKTPLAESEPPSLRPLCLPSPTSKQRLRSHSSLSLGQKSIQCASTEHQMCWGDLRVCVAVTGAGDKMSEWSSPGPFLRGSQGKLHQKPSNRAERPFSLPPMAHRPRSHTAPRSISCRF